MKETGLTFQCYGITGAKIVLNLSSEYRAHFSEIVAYGYDLNNPCNEIVCDNDAECVVTDNGMPHCDCLPGWEGVLCEDNTNDCDHEFCQNGSVCQDEINDYTCICPAGFEGQHCELNIDDCLTNDCQNNSLCIDDIDSYICQ